MPSSGFLPCKGLGQNNNNGRHLSFGLGCEKTTSAICQKMKVLCPSENGSDLLHNRTAQLTSLADSTAQWPSNRNCRSKLKTQLFYFELT